MSYSLGEAWQGKYHMNLSSSSGTSTSTSTTVSSSSPTGVAITPTTLPIIDYIAKCDSDTMIYPEILLDELLMKLPSYPQNQYYRSPFHT